MPLGTVLALQRQVQIWYGVALSLLLCVLSYIKLLTPTLDDAVNRLGFVCCVFAVLMFGSPLSSVVCARFPLPITTAPFFLSLGF